METFTLLLSKELTNNERKIVTDIYNAQIKHKILTKRKFMLFWNIYSKYLELPELEYRKYYRFKTEQNAKLVRNVITSYYRR